MARARRHIQSSSEGVNLSIIITPMLDMAFQLLAFFIMTYNPPAREVAIEGQLLPPTKATSPIAKGDKAILDPSSRAGLTVIVRAVPAGKLRKEGVAPGQPTVILLKQPQDSQPREIARVQQFAAKAGDQPGDWPAVLKTLGDELAAFRANHTGKGLSLNIQADRSLRYGYFIAVEDVAKGAGFTSIGFNAPEQ
jgi:biopolymer transport protein ExbD